MRSLLLCVVTCVPALVAAQTVYSWEDAQGVHYTDDPSAVPLKARKVDKTTYEATVAPPKAAAPAELVAKNDEVLMAQPGPVQPAPASSTPGSQEALWRSRFIGVHRRIAFLRDTISSLESAVPPPTICTYAYLGRGCVANPDHARVRAQIAEHFAQLQDAERELEQLDRDASYQGIPREWRRGF